MFEYENDYLLLWIDEHVHLMYSEWLRPVTSEEYQEGNKMLVKLLHERDIRGWIADSSKLGDISETDQVWTLQEIVPVIAASNLLRLARISGADTNSHAKFEHFAHRVKPENVSNIQLKQFMTYKEAADWVGNIPV